MLGDGAGRQPTLLGTTPSEWALPPRRKSLAHAVEMTEFIGALHGPWFRTIFLGRLAFASYSGSGLPFEDGCAGTSGPACKSTAPVAVVAAIGKPKSP